MHSRSAIRPQLFHKAAILWRRGWRLGFVCVMLCAAAPAFAQPSPPGPIHRVFMKSGEALPSYGEAAIVGERVVFNLSIGVVGGPHALQLVSLPTPLVDVERTTRYAHTVRAAFYAAVRGETEFASMTAALSRDMQLLNSVEDRRRQLVLAEDLRQRVAAWPRAHYYYRVEDVDRLVALVDDVINELQTEVGERSFALELSAGPRAPARETLLPAPSLVESISLALATSAAADIGEDRLGVLRAAAGVAAAGDTVVRAQVARRIAQEEDASRRYEVLGAEVRRRARTAGAAGDVAAVDRLETELLRRDQQLGFRRPQEVQALMDELVVFRVTARARREAAARYGDVRQRLLAYEREIRPALSGLDGLRSVLEYVRDARTIAFERVVLSEERLERMRASVDRVVPPEDVRAVHETLVGAINLAREACARRRQAAVTNVPQTLREASSAAAGALLLGDRARRDLVDVLCLGGQVVTCGTVVR